MALPQVGVEAVIQNLNGFRNGSRVIVSAFEDMDKGASKVEKSSTSLGRQFTNLGDSIFRMGGFAVGAVAGVTALATGLASLFVTDSIEKASQLDSQLASIAATMGIAKSEAEPLKQLIFDLALDPQLSVSASQAADSIEKLVQNGLTMQEVLDGAAKSVIQLSNSTGSDFVTSAAVATDLIAVFGLETEDLGRAVDGVNGVLQSTKLSVEDYALALANGGAIAANTGVSLEDFNTIIASSASFFSSGADAGTSFKTALQRLSNPTAEVQALMAELGISIFNSDGSMRSMAEIAGQLNTALGGMTEAQRSATAAQLGGADASRTILALSQLTEEQFNSLSESVNRQGQAAAAAATRLDSFKGAMEILGGVIEAIQIQIGDQFLPVLRQLTVGFTEIAAQAAPMIVDAFGQISTGVQNLIAGATSLFATFQSSGIAGIAEALGITPAAIELINKVGQTIQQAAQVIGGVFLASINNVSSGGALQLLNSTIEFVNENFEAFKGAIIGVATVLAGAAFTSAVVGAIGLITGLLNPITAIIAIAATLGAAWSANWFGIRDTTAEVIATLQPVLAEVQTWLQTNIPLALQTLSDLWNTNWPAISEALSVAWGTISTTFTEIQTWLQTNIPIALQTLTDLWNTNWPLMSTNLSTSFAQAIEFFTQIQTWLGTNIPAALQTLSSLWNTNWPTIAATALTAWEIIQGVFNGIVQVMTASVLPSLQSSFENINQALANLGLNWGDVWNALKTATEIVLTAIGAAILAIIGTITGLVSATASALATITEIWAALMDNVTLIITGITQALVGVSTVWQGIISGDWAQIWDGFSLILEGNINTIRGLFGSLINIVTAPLATVASFIQGFVDGVTGFFQGLYDTLVGNSIVPDLINDIVGWFSALPDMIVGALGGLTDAVSGVFSGIGSIFGGGDEEAAAPAIDLSALSFDTGTMQAGLTAISTLLDAITQKLVMIHTTTLLALQAAFVAVSPVIVASALVPILTTITQIDTQTITISITTLPQLLTVSQTVSAGMVAAFMQVVAVLNQLMAIIMQLIAQIARLGEVASQAANDIIEAFQDVVEAFGEAGEAAGDLESDIKSLASQYSKLAAAAKEAAAAAGSVAATAASQGLGLGAKQGLGLMAGIGFQGGTLGLGLGFKVPGGFPNDTFPIRVSSGEEVMVTPRGQTIEGVIAQRLGRMVSGPASISGPVLGATGNTTINYNNFEFGRNNIQSGIDVAVLEATIERVIARKFG